MSNFVHLHTHTEYSLLDGAASIKKIIKRTKDLGMTAIAITDHGAMYGVVDFYKKAKEEGIKPIIGCEVYVAARTRFDKVYEIDAQSSHLVLLAKNDIGYENLIFLTSAGFTQGFYYKPRIDMDLLKQHSEGIIALSACLGGQIPRALLNDDYNSAKEIAKAFVQIFGKDDFYIELQDHNIEEQKRINPLLIKLANELDIGLVATNDVHYVDKEDSQVQDVLMCIQTGKLVSDSERMRFDTDEFYLKSPNQMTELFKTATQAIENTVKIADMCNVEFEFGKLHLPKFDVPENKDAFIYLKELCYNGLKERYENVTDELTTRLEYELEVIKSMGYVDYFLIVWDFIDYARKNYIMVGPGRGSAAGSIVSYCLKITSIDPIKYSLLFERFLNPERVSMPDIDIDFCYERRQEVIDYVIRKYGEDRVSQIITFGTMKAKQAIRDVGRVLNIPLPQVDVVAKLIPFELHMTIERALELSGELRELYENDKQITKLIDMAKALEGLTRHASTHAAGVVISEKPVVHYVPLQTNDNVVTTQFTMTTLEELGLLKMDFLGLRNLTVIRDAIEIIKKSTGNVIDINLIDYNCKEVYDLIGEGNTDGVFQLESAGMKQFMRELKPNSLEDIIAGISLYRPGPMEQIPRYIKNKNNPSLVTYKHTLLEPILDVTYGCMVYQEQVLEIVRSLAGYSLGKADMLRRTISKKKAGQMAIERQNFIYGQTDDNGNVVTEGAIRRGIDEKIAISIFDEINDFANYAFNKSHAAAYAVIAYQTAYLKTFYPTEYMAALISSVSEGSNNKASEYIQSCKKLGIALLPPSINKSLDSFTVEGNLIRFGLSVVKNVGKNIIKAIILERERGGHFDSLTDFAQRIPQGDINKRAIEALIKCGAFDELGSKRSQLLANFEQVLDGVSRDRKVNVVGQMSLFGLEDNASGSSVNSDNFAKMNEFTKFEMLAMEKETIGFYLSGHPLDEYVGIISCIASCNIGQIVSIVERDEDGNFQVVNSDFSDGDRVVVCGIISSKKVKLTKNNTQMAFVNLEDLYANIEMIVFPKTYTQYFSYINEEAIVIIEGRLSIRGDEEPKLICESIRPLDSDAFHKLYIQIKDGKDYLVDVIKPILAEYAGNTPVYLYIEAAKQCKLSKKDSWVKIEEKLIQSLLDIFDSGCVKIK